MNEIEQLIHVVGNKNLSNVFATGYIDNGNGVKRFHPMLDSLYLEFQDQLVRCASVDQYWNLSMSLVDGITCDFNIDEDDEFGVASISELVLKSPDGRNRVTAIRVYVNDASRVNQGVVKCACFDLQRMGLCETAMDWLFLDPQNPFGIQIGKQDAEDEWRRANLGLDSNYRELTWRVG